MKNQVICQIKMLWNFAIYNQSGFLSHRLSGLQKYVMRRRYVSLLFVIYCYLTLTFVLKEETLTLFISKITIFCNFSYSLYSLILSIKSQFYIQLVFKAPLCITLTISDQKIVSGSLFFQFFQTFSKKK